MDKTISVSALHTRIPDPVLFLGLREDNADQWASYLYSRPKEDTTKLSSRSHLVGLYDPFASRDEFPAGRRWCVNVYTGCAFSCKYCYAVGYIQNAFKPRVKKDFQRCLRISTRYRHVGSILHPFISAIPPIPCSRWREPISTLSFSLNI
jgi:hypothetical protein